MTQVAELLPSKCEVLCSNPPVPPPQKKNLHEQKKAAKLDEDFISLNLRIEEGAEIGKQGKTYHFPS
jgi:hypothetical protein